MRFASRVIGVVLAMAGLGFFAIGFGLVTGTFDNRSVLDTRGPETAEWIAGAAVIAVGLGLLFGGWYYFRLEPNEPDAESNRQPSRFAIHVIRHRRELKLLAQAGLVLSSIRFLAVCFGANWLGNRVALVLSWVSIGLVLVSFSIQNGEPNGRLDLERAPESVRPAVMIIGKAITFTLWAWGAFFVWRQWHHESPSFIVQAGLPVILFTWSALIFAYGLRSREEIAPVA